MGRTAIKIDWKIVAQLCEAGCKGSEIAGYIGMSPIAFYERCQADHKMKFTDFRQQHLSKGNALIRSKQYEIALKGKGDKDMLKWLGKNRLNQADRSDISHQSTTVNLNHDPKTMSMDELINVREQLSKNEPRKSNDFTED